MSHVGNLYLFKKVLNNYHMFSSSEPELINKLIIIYFVKFD